MKKIKSKTKIRLDVALVKRGFVETRMKARDLVLNGSTYVNSIRVLKPSFGIEEGDNVVIKQETHQWVSRAAQKLSFAVAYFNLNFMDQIIFDLGASTGGFTEVAVRNGAMKVFSFDVGHGQLHKSLKENLRVVDLSGIDVRNIRDLSLPKPNFLLVDLSFISLTKALKEPMGFCNKGSLMICLVKPQFELTRGDLNKKGVVKSPSSIDFAISKVSNFIQNSNWKVLGVTPSPILGRSGNREFLLHAKKV